MNQQTFYLTTAIAYTSRKPHIGNTYEIVLSDAIARFKRLLGYDTYFLTGTDEHGQKIEQSAHEAGATPQAYVDNIASQIKDIWDLMNCSYDQFIRTTDAQHVKTVQKIFKKLYDQGDIYKGEYQGLYCTPCESFWTESQLTDGCCPDCSRPVSLTKEEAYFFRMSNYQQRLIQHIEQNPDFIQPESRKREMIGNFLKPGLQDLCVSRTSFSWGIPVDFDSKHVVYVWLDALTNYITALGYDPDGNHQALFEQYWPCDVHVIGKDILRFHTIYWPIMLMALDLPLPKQVLGHPWLMSGSDKMSKSRDNVIYADDLAAHFGVDAVRYYLLKEIPYASDGTITYESLIARYNTDLANTLGNLINRTIAMTQKYFNSVIKNPNITDSVDASLRQTMTDCVGKYSTLMNQYKVAEAVDLVMNAARRCNKYIDETMPWQMAKNPDLSDRLQTVLYHLLESIRFLAVLLCPIMPATSDKIFAQLGTDLRSYESLETFGQLQHGQVGTPEPLFSRLDEAQICQTIQKRQEQSDKTILSDNPPQASGTITIDDFGKISLIAAKVLSCTAVKKSDKLLCLQLDDGSDTPRQVLSGIAPWYQCEQLVGKTVALVVNLKPIKLRGMQSCGMILAADLPDGSASVLFLDDSIPAGCKIR